MFKLLVYYTNDGSEDMVTSWEIISTDHSPGLADTEEFALDTVPQDFFTNFLDYYVSGGGALTKLGVPVGNTWNRPVDNNNFPFSIFRANSMDIFGSL